MFSQTTRLELIIVAAVLLVLFLCRQPPKPGTAGIRPDVEPTLREPAQGTEGAEQEADNDALSGFPTAADSLPTQIPGFSTGQSVNPGLDAGSLPARTMADNKIPAPVTPPPKVKRIGIVDARKCKGLNYDDVMYGNITVRWVWDGQKYVPRKVCEVKEKNGVTSIWVFDEHSDAVLSEIEQSGQ